jgi:DNA-binding MarR family transcriptional regulator
VTRRARRSEPSLELSMWLRLLKTHNLILMRVRRGMAGRCTLPQFDVLAQVARAPRGMTFRELSRSLLVSAGNLTGIVDRLETDGLVRREVVAHDRRSFRIRLTGAGRRRIGALIPRHREDLARILAPVPAGKLQELRTLLGEAARLIENGVHDAHRTGGARARHAG